MKKLCNIAIVLAFFLMFSGSYAYSDNMTLVSDNNDLPELELVNYSPERLSFSFSTGRISATNIKTETGRYVRINIPGFGKSNNVGYPELPVMYKLIEIPVNAGVEIKILNTVETKYDLNTKGFSNSVIPMQMSQPKCGSGNDFCKNQDIYSKNDYYGQDIVSVEVLGILRGANIGRLSISPVSYNPVTNSIKVIQHIEFEIKYTNVEQQLSKDLKSKTRSPYFNGLYSQLLNNQSYTSRDYITTYPVSYVIISDRMFEDQLQPFIEWKKRKGFTVTTAYTDEIGTSLQQIKDYIQGLYNDGTPENPAPSFVLFVGDIAQIPAWDNGDGVTDRNYVEYTGDLFPEIFYGRFSAENTTDLQPYIDKTLMYEQYTMPDPSYLDTVVMVSGVDGSYAQDWGNGQINYGTINYFNEDHDIYSHTYLYPASGSSSAAIIQNVSDGVTFGNYTAHCSPNGWADPSFVISDIPSLQNQDKYGLLIGNCCSSSEYQTDCFAEEILRAENKGCVGYIGGSNSTYWDEDYYFGVGVGVISENPPTYEETTLGNYDRSFHDHGEAFEDWFTTMDQIVFAGNLAVSESGSSREQYYWDIYNLMGDPSLMIYYSVPEVNNVTHDLYIMIGATSFTINAAPYSYVALNNNGENIVSVLADENGLAILEFESFTAPGTAELVITAQNYQPFIEDVQIFAPNGPFCIYENHTINDDSLGNGNNRAEFDEQVFINLSMVNYGNEPAADVEVVISSSCPDLTILDGTDTYDTIHINEVETNENGYLIRLSDDIEDQTGILFNVTAIDSQDSIWESEFEIIANAPKLTPLDLIVDDSQMGNDNGRLDPGENAIIKIKTANTGHCPAYDVVASLHAYNPYITVISGDTTIPMLSTFGSIYPEFDVIVDDNAPEGVLAEMKYQLTSGGYYVERLYYPKVGLILEDWETGDFSKYNWKNDGDLPWQINMAYPYEGYYDVISGEIGNNQTSEFWIQYQVMSSDSISFYKKVSSEQDSDNLKFYIDNVLQDEWSGTTQSWTREVYAVNPGLRKFRWVYEKDHGETGGVDKAWIDYIELPVMMVTTVYAGPDNSVCENNTFQCAGSATNFDSIYWETSGTGSFDNNLSLSPVYTPSEDDILNGNVMLSLNLIDVEGLPASDTMDLDVNYFPTIPDIPAGPQQIDLQQLSQSDYTTNTIPDTEEYSWNLSPADAGSISGNQTTGTVIWNNSYEGEAWIKVKGINNCGAGLYSDSLLVIVSNPADIKEVNNDIQVNIVPNPSTGKFILNVTTSLNGKMSVSISNRLGSVLYNNNIVTSNGDNSVLIDMEDQPNGLYFVKTSINNNIKITKLILVN